MTQRYFAYGSNLNTRDWQGWCEREGYSPDSLQPLFPAFLPDRELRFTYRSTTRGGGVLDVVPRPGKLVPGVVFEVTEDGWKALDAKEGAPCAYRRIETECLTPDGAIHPVAVYEVNPKVIRNRHKKYEPPPKDYVDIVRQGLQAFDLDCGPLEAARENKPSPDLVDAIFVYGTLLRGECRHHMLEAAQPKCILLAEVPGRLLDFGEYPGLDLAAEDNEWIFGEFVRVKDITQLLEKLDCVEVFRGYGAKGSLFRRVLIETGMCDGRTRLAWMYVTARRNAPRLPGGNWRASRGRWTELLEKIVRGHRGALSERELAERVVKSRCFGGSEADIADLLPLTGALERRAVSERELAQASGRWAVEPE